MRKISLRLLPLMFLLYVASQVDRTNVAMASLQMNRAIGLSAAAYGFGAGIFFLGYGLFELPSNLILVRVGARRWIARIAITWGLLSCAMMFARGPKSFYALRFLLGIAEAGYFPGILFYLSRWFPDERRARAISRFMIGTPLASVIGGPLGAFLLGFDGRLGLAGWQWLFLVEGLPAVILGVVALVILTERPADATWLSANEKEWLQATIAREASRPAMRHFGVLETLKNPTVWLLAVALFLTLMSMAGINLSAQAVTRDVSHLTNHQIGWITGAIGLIGLSGMLMNGWHSDRTGERVVHVVVPVLFAAVGLLLAGISSRSAFIIGGMALVTASHSTMMPAFWSLPSSFLRGTSAAAGIALVNSVGMIGGSAGPPVIGSLKNATGTYSMAFLVLSASAFSSAILLLWLRARRTLAQ